ncbi:MAG: AEC family transporter [Mycobacterium leprae]
MSLLTALLNTVLPVFILASLGYIARVKLKAEPKEVAKVTIYFMTPGLILNSILTTELVAGDIGKIIGFGVLLTAIMIAVTMLLGWALGWRPAERSAATLTTAFMNAANFGLPVVLLALGQAGFDRAAVFVVFESLMMYSTAVFIAAQGKMDAKQALLAVFKLPLVWAVIAGLLVRLTGITLPAMLMKPIGMLASATPVVVVIILGMQVASIKMKGARVKIAAATLMRLFLSPAIAILLVGLLHPEPLIGKVLILESAMPASVNVNLVAVQFDAEPDQVSGATLATTIFSLVSLTFWVWFVQR